MRELALLMFFRVIDVGNLPRNCLDRPCACYRYGSMDHLHVSCPNAMLEVPRIDAKPEVNERKDDVSNISGTVQGKVFQMTLKEARVDPDVVADVRLTPVANAQRRFLVSVSCRSSRSQPVVGRLDLNHSDSSSVLCATLQYIGRLEILDRYFIVYDLRHQSTATPFFLLKSTFPSYIFPTPVSGGKRRRKTISFFCTLYIFCW
ncbi:hypothetical protein L2E82_06695 [Cichorium intybus]|uniref:Uncharacterized protein n=1 Tax=Cichorium intybus TaxID=13427 RepID=A0ACB9HA89_CICIN|nr:hypothetical protein L2E82_06695 [Cichorium intybus]